MAREANLKGIDGLIEGLLGAHAITGQWPSNQFVSVCAANQPVTLEHIAAALKNSLAGEAFGTYRAAVLIHLGFRQGPADQSFREVLHAAKLAMFQLLDSRKAARLDIPCLAVWTCGCAA